MRDFAKAGQEEPKPTLPEIELTDEQKENLIQQEMDDKMRQVFKA